MRIQEIINLLKSYILFGIIAIILFIIGYGLVYKKIMKGKRTINKSKLFLYCISICYMFVVIGATFLSRGINYGTINLHLLSSYRQAYNCMQISLFRNIVLNILLFVPLGFLLPFYSKKMQKFYITIPIGCFITLIIEILQFVTKIGIFEIDDILNNSIGVVIGYSSFMILKSIATKQNRNKIPLYILPIILTIGIFVRNICKIRKSRTRKFAI